MQIAGGDVAALMSQIAQSVAANFTVTIIHSQALGTQAQELAGAPGFDLDVNSAYSTPANVTRWTWSLDTWCKESVAFLQVAELDNGPMEFPATLKENHLSSYDM